MYDVTAIGELLIDFAARDTDAAGYPTMKANPGGAPGNFLAALSKYGLRTAFLGKVGTDAFGGLLINTLKEAGIETKGIRQDSSSIFRSRKGTRSSKELAMLIRSAFKRMS